MRLEPVKNYPVVFVSIFDIWPKKSLFASIFLNFQLISPIPEFLNSVFQDRSIGTHLKLFFISELFILKFYENRFPVGNFNLR